MDALAQAVGDSLSRLPTGYTIELQWGYKGFLLFLTRPAGDYEEESVPSVAAAVLKIKELTDQAVEEWHGLHAPLPRCLDEDDYAEHSVTNMPMVLR